MVNISYYLIYIYYIYLDDYLIVFSQFLRLLRSSLNFDLNLNPFLIDSSSTAYDNYSSTLHSSFKN